MAKTWILKFAFHERPDDIFDLIVNGKKTIETRPATKNFQVGDKLILVSLVSKRKIYRKITFIHKYDSIEEMVAKEDEEKIFPKVGSKENLLKIYEDIKKKWGKKYKDSLDHQGIVAIGIK